MIYQGIPIGAELSAFSHQLLRSVGTVAEANDALKNACGILDFFPNEADWTAFKTIAESPETLAPETERAEFGDFQTNPELALKVCKLLKDKGLRPKKVLEPTFGQGNFILAALQTFESVEEVVGVEIYEPYVWQTKFALLDFFRQNPGRKRPVVRLFCQSVFRFDFSKYAAPGAGVLVLGNPPWVTSAMLSTLDSVNLPHKSNFKNHAGLDAITGKGNFDIGEFITLMLVRGFEGGGGHIAFLVKNAVAKNLVQDQKRNRFRLSALEQHDIDAPAEFRAAVEATLFFAEFGAETPETSCEVRDFYTQKTLRRFGWAGDCFASDLEKYRSAGHLDGKSPLEWRQGLKHDCSKIMEFERHNGHFVNGRGQALSLEPDLVYRLLKSSDLKNPLVGESRKFTIITQKKVGQETAHIRRDFPRTWGYLSENQADFDNRKSSIYRDKPPFSIFGIGDYSFQPYKAAISGLYKTSRFSLVLPRDGKPMMLDDTCYFLGFSRLDEAAFTVSMLNSEPVQRLLESLVFWDSKRPITKDLLMRLDLGKISAHLAFADLQPQLGQLETQLEIALDFRAWEKFRATFQTAVAQLSMF